MKLPIQIKLVVIALAALAAVYAAVKGAEYKQKQDLKESLNNYEEATDKIQEYTKELEKVIDEKTEVEESINKENKIIQKK